MLSMILINNWRIWKKEAFKMMLLLKNLKSYSMTIWNKKKKMKHRKLKKQKPTQLLKNNKTKKTKLKPKNQLAILTSGAMLI